MGEFLPDAVTLDFCGMLKTLAVRSRSDRTREKAGRLHEALDHPISYYTSGSGRSTASTCELGAPATYVDTWCLTGSILLLL